MKRIMAVFMVVFLVLATATPANAEQTCQDVAGVGVLCLTVDGGQVTVTGPLGIDLSAEAPTIEVPVPVPGPTQTVTVPPPAPATVTRTAPPTRAATETATITATPPTVTETSTATRTIARTSPPSPQAGQEQDRPDTIIERVVRNAGVPLLFVILGIALAIGFQYVMYAVGRNDGKHADDKWIESLLNRKRN